MNARTTKTAVMGASVIAALLWISAFLPVRSDGLARARRSSRPQAPRAERAAEPPAAKPAQVVRPSMPRAALHGSAEPRPGNLEAAPSAPARPDVRDPESVALDRITARRTTGARARWLTEDADPTWTAETMAYVGDAVQANHLDIATRSVECRTTLCRVELQAKDMLEAQQLLELARPDDADLLVDQMPTAGNDGVAVVYISRPEYPF